MQRFIKSVFLNTSSAQPCKSKRRKKGNVSPLSYETLEKRELLAALVWTSGDITGDVNVSTNGTSVFAINGTVNSGSTRSVNGVSFVQSTRANAAAQSQAQSPGSESLTVTLGNDNASAFEDGGLGGNIGDLIEGGWWGADSGNTASVNLAGLTVGGNYEIQIFSNDARSSRGNNYITRLGNGNGGAGIDLELSNRPSGGAAGDFGIGTFTADATTQSFELSGILNGGSNTGRIQINAIQLRKLEPVDLLPGAHPLVNEFSASNSNVIDDDNGNSSDWIEIFNAGEDTVDLAGYSLTDNPTDKSKYVFPSTTLVGGQYLVVFAGDDADPTSGTDLYTEFGLSSSGEYLGFYDPMGNLVSEFGAGGSDYPAQVTDVSYGYVADDTYSTPSFFATATPGSANVNPIVGVIDDLPTVSVERGFYDEAFNVDIASETPGASVVYTTDGSEPSSTNGTRVNPANSNSLVQFNVNISETTSLRTAAVRDGFLTRGATTHTYVFLDDVISSSLLDPAITDQYTDAELRAGLLDIPTLSFNYENEITNSFVPEQAASIEWLAPDGSAGFQIDAGISGFGGFFTNFQKKNFRVEFRSEYGESQLNFPLFEGFDNGIPATDSFDSLDFRSGSHDRVSRGFGLSNRFVDDTLMEAGHIVPHGRYVHIYNNGEYWGQYHLRERWDADFLSQYYGGEEDDYEAVNGNVNNGNSTPNGWAPGEVYDGDGTAWQNINALADTAGNGNPEGPTGGYQELKEAVNLPQYIDYMLVWMAGNSENEYRAGGSSDGSVPYTFTLNDADGWLRSTSDKTNNAGPGNILGTLVSEADPEFLALYADRIQNMFGEGGVLSAERSVERLQNRLDEMELSFVLESARWSSIGEARTPDSFASQANSAIQNMLPNIAPTMIANFRNRSLFPSIDAPSFAIDGVFQNGGAITAGDVLTLDASDTIYYTTDGSDPRLEGGNINPNAIAYDPSGSTTTIFSLGSEWSYLDDGSNEGELWRNPSFNDSGWDSGLGQLGYGDGDESTSGLVDYGGDDNFKHITTYFRRTFDISESFDTATLDLVYDDGAVVYLNGDLVEVVNFGSITDDDLINYLTEAEGAPGDNATTSLSLTDLLVQGSNTLAIEIHQASRTSSDISFDAALNVTTQPNEAAGIPLTTSTNVQARTFNNGEWSAVRDATFVIPASQSDLQITEINYNPADPTTAEITAGYINNDDFEFIELHNPNVDSSISLSGLEFIFIGDQLDEGVAIPLGDIDLLPGEYAVIVENIPAFQARYGNEITVLGQWSGGLSNNSERITLVDAAGDEIASVEYDDADPWPVAADGNGSSLDLIDHAGTTSDLLDKPYAWRASVQAGGTPGAASISPSGIIINEVLAHTDAPDFDTVELYNPTSSAISIGGWYLSDAGSDRLEYQIPAGTTIPAQGYLTLDENSNFDFAFSGSEGDEVYLTEVTTSGDLHLHDSIAFGASFNGVTLGRTPDGTRLVPMTNNTLGSINGAFAFESVTLSEINYHPLAPDGSSLTSKQLEFVEVTNTSDATVSLTDWQIRGEVDFDFANGQLLNAESSAVIVSFDPLDTVTAAAFRLHYGVDAGVTLLGPFQDDQSLSNSYGVVKLQRPDSPPSDNLTFTPHINVDEVFYDDRGEWPSSADGDGPSLHRIGISTLGAFAGSWVAADPTPGNASAPSVESIVFNQGNNEESRSEITSITVEFDSDVSSVDATNFELTHVGSGQLVTGLAVQVTGNTARINFTTGDWIISSSVAGVEATLADGEYELRYRMTGFFGANSSTDSFFRRYGLTSDEGTVGLSDFAAFRSSFGKAYDPSDLNNGFRSDLDANRDGEISLTDFAAFRAAFGN